MPREVRAAGVSALACVLLWGCGDDGGHGSSVSATAPDLTTASGATTGADPTTGVSSNGPSGEPATGEPFPGCEGVELEQDGVLDLDIPAALVVVVSGSIRLNGEAMPDASGPRGQIVIESTSAKGRLHVATYSLAATGPENYSLVVTAGTAAIRWEPPVELCAAEPDGPMPCTGGTLLAGVDLGESGVLDLDVPAVTVSGVVTQNGAAMPDEGTDRGHLEFVGPAGHAVATPALGTAGAATHAVTLFPGAHDVDFVGNPARCGDPEAVVPCNRGALARELALETSGVLDLDLAAVTVTGAVTVGGEPAPDAAFDRGALRLRPAGAGVTGEALTAGFGASGPIAYTLALVAGTYDVELVANAALCDGTSPPLPCESGRLLAGVELTSSGVLDVDVPRIEVSGAVTLKGAPLPDATGDRGALVFTREDGGAATVALAATGPRTYVLGLLPGHHALGFVANAGLCDGVAAPAMPCTGALLQGVELTQSGVLDVDLDAVEVAGAVTLAGASLPDEAGDRGSLVFTRGDGSQVAAQFGAAGPVNYALTVFPGAHDVHYVSAQESCVADSAMPCGGGRLHAGVALVADGVLDVDVPAIALSGLVNHAGAPLPDLAQPRGALRWTRIDGDGGLVFDLGAAGPGQYALSLMPGRWVVEHAANLALCADAPPELPCVDQVLIGCPNL